MIYGFLRWFMRTMMRTYVVGLFRVVGTVGFDQK